MSNKTVLITGATRGLGASLARAYRHRGYHVIGLARDAAALEALKQAGTLDDTLVCDLADANQIDAAILALDNRYRRLDVLVHNAAIQSAYAIAATSQYAQLARRELEVNYLAPVRLTAGLLPQLLAAKAQIVVITSLLQRASKPTAPGYSASKAALASWSSNLRHQLRAHGVRVCEVVPGLINTDMSAEGRAAGRAPDELAAIMLERLPATRVVLPGARLGWLMSRAAPGLFQSILNKQ